MRLKQFFLFLIATVSLIISGPTFAQTLTKDAAPKNECDKKDFDLGKFYNGAKLFDKAANKVNQLIQAERAAGRDPKVFLIARAGQDLSGVITLKDYENRRPITLQDIFNDVDPSRVNIEASQVAITQEAIKRRYGDPKRPLTYSHVGFLVINHPVNTNPMQMADGVTIEGRPGDFWVEELLKPCKTLAPKAWVTGLPMFFQDDPHEFRSLIMVPEQQIQDQLMELLFRDEIQNPFLASTYNVAAPYDDVFEENSATWVLDIIAAAQFPNVRATKSRQMAHRLLRENGYVSTKLLASSFKMRMATSVFAPNSVNIRNETHRFARPYGVMEFVTELSVREYLLRNRLVRPDAIHEVYVDEKERYKEPVGSADRTVRNH